MNSNLRFARVFRVCGWLLLLEALFLLLPMCVSLACGEDDWWTFLAAAVSAGAVGGGAAYFLRGCPSRLNRLDAFLLTTMVWVLFSGFGMIPFMAGSLGADAAGAFFETMSGFTTTGATVIADVESQTRGLLFWRSLIQWIGGLGIVLFILAVLPALNRDGGISMFNAEMTGISHDKLHPRIRQTAKSLWEVYGVLTAVLALLLWLGPMDFFDSVCQSMTTMSTGGFSTRNDSIAGFGSRYVAAAVTLFMLVGGVNFTLIYNMSRGDFSSLRRNTVVKVYAATVAAIYAVLAVSLAFQGNEWDWTDFLLRPMYLIASAITTTGFSYGGFEAWGPVALTLVFVMMLTGACAGSTTGAVKLDRFTALARHARNEVMLGLYPNRMMHVDVNGRMLNEGQMSRIYAFIVLYLALILAGTLVLAACGFSFTDSLFATTSCIGNNGLGYGATGGSFSVIPSGAKWMLSALMLVGRLELFTVIALFIPSFWKK